MIFKAIITPLTILVCVCSSNAELTNNAKKTTTRELIQLLLAQDLGTRKFAFADVVHAATGKKVLPLDPENDTHETILKAVHQAAKETTTKLSRSDSPVRKLRRINEASRFFEEQMMTILNKHPRLQCVIPKNNKGNEQRSGYPDMLITYTATDGSQTHAYLDPKLFEQKSRASSLRTFYYEPRTHTNKIQHDALHLLIGISHDGQEGAWKFTHWELCDLSHFQVRLKAEFQASNRDLYRKPTLLPAPDQ